MILKNTRYIIIALYIIVLTPCFLQAQFIEIEDSNFAKCIFELNSSLVNTAKTHLDTNKAAAYTNSVNCSNRYIYTANEITYFKKTKFFDLSKNKLSRLPDFPSNMSIIQFDFSNNQLTEIPNFSGRDSLIHGVWLQNNKISNADRLSEFRSIQNINLYNNPLNTFPDLSHIYIAKNLTLGENNIPIEDLLWIKDVDSQQVFHIFPMRTTNNQTLERTVFEYDTLYLSVSNTSSFTNFTYQWFRNNQLYIETNEPKLTIPKATSNEDGKWTSRWHSNTGKLVLDTIYYKSTSWDIKINPCQTVLDFEVSNAENCKTSSVKIETLNITNPDSSFEIILYNTLTLDSIILLDTKENNIPFGEYSYIIKNNKGCIKTIDKQLIISRPKTGCDIYFTPNGDGFDDTYHIKDNGVTTIYNSKSEIINTLQGPTHWDGTNSTGNPLPAGIYILTNENGDSTIITVMY